MDVSAVLEKFASQEPAAVASLGTLNDVQIAVADGKNEVNC
jgi:hypothetical protein